MQTKGNKLYKQEVTRALSKAVNLKRKTILPVSNISKINSQSNVCLRVISVH